MDFIDYLTEAPEKHGVLAYARMNPPHGGHEQVINKVHEVAKEHNAVHKESYLIQAVPRMVKIRYRQRLR